MEMTCSIQLLFVYGTLRPGLARGEPAALIHGLKWLGPAMVRGSLYDLGGYPGLLAGAGFVHGDLLVIDSPARLAALDAYEECEGPKPLYVREIVSATRPDGSRVDAWAYSYVGPVATGTLIPGGDYADRGSRA